MRTGGQSPPVTPSQSIRTRVQLSAWGPERIGRGLDRVLDEVARFTRTLSVLVYSRRPLRLGAGAVHGRPNTGGFVVYLHDPDGHTIELLQRPSHLRGERQM